MERLPVRRHVRRLALLALVAMALAALSGLPAAAQTTVTQPLEDTQAEFAQGTFQRTAVFAGTTSGGFPDQDGTVELATAGALNTWGVSATSLPDEIGAMGVATLGNRLFTVGGATSANNDAFTNAVYWATVNQLTGDLEDRTLTTPPPGATFERDEWVNDPLPQVAAYMNPAPRNGCAGTLIGARSAPAVAGLSTPAGKNFIYVIGGTFRVDDLNCLATSPGNLTSPAVQIGEFNPSNGDLSWSSEQANYLPSQSDVFDNESWDNAQIIGLGDLSFGVTGATASIVTTSRYTFLYVIGGYASYPDPLDGFERNLITPAVFYTRVNTNTGALENPLASGTGTPWARTANVPLNDIIVGAPSPGELGIYGHTAMVSEVVVGGGADTTRKQAIFVTGGYTARPGGTQNGNAALFRAMVADDETGALAWTAFPDPNRPADPVSIERGRYGAGGIALGNKLYVLGGVSNPLGSPESTITLGVHDDAHSMLPLFGSGGTLAYFVGGQTENVIEPVHSLGAAAILATALPNATTVDRTAWGFALGGFTPGGPPTDIIRRGSIGGRAETSAATRIPDGWYYSRFHNIRFEAENTEARILSVRWYTEINRQTNPSADIQFEVQRTKVFPCAEAAFAGQPWVPIDGDPDSAFFSKDGFNDVRVSEVFPDPNASCFRYRAKLIQGGSSTAASPRLFSVNIEKIKPGDPDLFLENFEIGPDASGRISTFSLQIKNLNGTEANTIPAQVNVFPVVLCVAYAPLDEPEPTLSVPDLPIVNDPDNRVNCAPVYRWISGQATQPGEVVDISGGAWRVNFDNIIHIPGKGVDDLLSAPQEAFAVPGHYAVAALIDPLNLVTEGGAIKANNRGENLNDGQPLIRRFTITEQGFTGKTYLPMVRK